MRLVAVKPFALSCLLFPVLLLEGGCSFPKPGQPGYFVVDSTTDSVDVMPGNGVCLTSAGTCTLRAAIQESNALAGDNTIELPAGTYLLTLPGNNGASQGDLNITGSVRLLGAGASSTRIDGNGAMLNTGIFQVQAGSLQVQDVTLRNGGSPSVPAGGGIRLDTGSVFLTRVVMTGNQAFSNGGAIAVAAGLLSIIDSTLDSNVVTSRGGGLYAAPETTIGITRTTFSNNQSTLGGAIQNFGTLTLENCTVSGNSGSAGTGGIINVGTMDLNNVTITDNTSSESSAGRAGGLASNGGVLHLRNTLIAGNHNPGGSPDCAGPLESRGHNLIQDTTGCTLSGMASGDKTGVNPQLGLLADNGGPTRTHALGTTSPAREAGSPATPGDDAAFACATNDQRSVARPQGARCDIGAFEL